eukprot:TCONS_00048389-protein
MKILIILAIACLSQVHSNELEIEEQLEHLLSDVDALRHDLGAPQVNVTEAPTEPMTEKPTEPSKPEGPKRPIPEPEKPEKPDEKRIPVVVLMKSMKAKVGDLFFNMFTVMEIMKGMEDFKGFKMLKMKMRPSEFLEIFIEDLKRTYFESLKMKVMIKTIMKERKEGKEEHSHEKEKVETEKEDEHEGEEEEGKEEKHFNPKELLSKLQIMWKVMNLACKDKDYLKNIETVDSIKEMMEGFDKIPMAVRKLKEIKEMVRYMEHKKMQELVNPRIPLKSLVKLSVMKVTKLIYIMKNASEWEHMAQMKKEQVKELLKEEVKEEVKHQVMQMAQLLKEKWENLPEKKKVEKKEEIKEKVQEMIKEQFKQRLKMKVHFMKMAIAHVADTFWTLKKLRVMFSVKGDKKVELKHMDHGDHMLHEEIKEFVEFQHFLRGVEDYFNKHEFWMDHPGFPWKEMHIERMKSIMQLEKILQAAPYLFRRMKFMRNVFEMKLEEL